MQPSDVIAPVPATLLTTPEVDEPHVESKVIETCEPPRDDFGKTDTTESRETTSNVARHIYQEADIVEMVHRNSVLGSKLRPFMKAEEQRYLDIQYPEDISECETRSTGDSVIQVKNLSPSDKRFTSLVMILTLIGVAAMCVWSQEGLLPQDHLGHVHKTKKRVGHVHSPIYTAPAHVELHGTQSEVFDVRLIGMSMADHAGSHGLGHSEFLTGKLTYHLLADGTEFFNKTVDLSDTEEVEHFVTIDVRELGKHGAAHYTAHFTAVTSDGRPVGFMCQVLRMGVGARYRFAIALSIFCVTFASIVAEKIHRSYSAFLGASATCARSRRFRKLQTCTR